MAARQSGSDHIAGGQGLLLGLDHVQVAMPVGAEAAARAFYGGVLGLREEPKPVPLASRGGVWYRCGNQMVHLSVEPDFRPQRKAHPAFRVADLNALRRRLEAADCSWQDDEALPGYERFYAFDPFGNRLEFLCEIEAERAHDEVAAAAPPDGGEQVKERVREVFGRSAEAYVTSPGHARGEDLTRMIELAVPRSSDFALDVSTGGGHVAGALAPHVGRVVASDLTPAMLAAARRFLLSRGVSNADFVVADAERLPFLDETFSLVTVRIAPHHYAAVERAVREMARVLTPGGRLALVDNIAPEDAELDALSNDWEKRRDPSHVRNYRVSEWRAFFVSAGLHLMTVETQRKTHEFAAWVERTRMPVAERAVLEADMLAAPEHVRRYFEIDERDGHVVKWTSDAMIALATKAER